ncbi:MAG: hypothetical protein LBU76_10605 [Azoarcus sp.]|jgi:3-oxoacyl-[acyl-carrier-protein] synthase-1|nr:hypothetical protein [Azoarcus sp.]
MSAARPVYIRRIAHVSALGLCATEAARTLRAGRRNLSEHTLHGETWPWFALPFAEENWTVRARRALNLLATELADGKPPSALGHLPLFVGSSANGTGAIEAAARIAGSTDISADDTVVLNQEIRLAFGCDAAPWMFSTACTSGLAALEAAFTLIAQGEINEAIVLGADFASTTALAGFSSLGLLARTPKANGLILGEAAAGMLLTTRPGSGWRIAACRMGIDGHSPTLPAPDGHPIAANIAAALDDAKLAASQIDFIKPHRGGLAGIDDAENAALNIVFGTNRPLERPIKHQIGHTLGASGPAEITALLAQSDQSGACSPQRLLFSFAGFGGSMAAVIIERCPAPESGSEKTAPPPFLGGISG